MKNQSKRATARISKNGKYLIVNSNGHTTILNANLVRYLFDIPYTRKDGTHVSTSRRAARLKIKASALARVLALARAL